MNDKITRKRRPLAMLLIAIALVLILSSCSTNKQQITNTFYQQNTLTKCVEILPKIESNTANTAAAIQNALIEWRSIYIDCALRHNTLVETINEVQHENHTNN